MNPGDWFILPDGQLATVVEVSGEPPMVLAQTSAGGVVDRPLANAQQRWRPVPVDGLRVRSALEPERVRGLAQEDPMEIVVLALRDAGGEATTTELRSAVGLLLGEEAGAAWWKRNQPKLNRDPRIDDSAALSKRYRLVGPGRVKLERRREERTGVMRAGLELLDGPTLKRNREQAKTARRTDEEAERLLRFAVYVDDTSIDPTDRFLAGEIGVLVGRWPDDELGRRLGSAVEQVDLLRVVDHESRTRVLSLFGRTVDQEDRRSDAASIPSAIPPTLASAVALGDRWGERALALGGRLDISPRALVVAGITWAVPGSEAAGDVDTSRDFAAYLTRVSDLSTSLQPLEPSGLDEQTHILLQAMGTLATTFQKGDRWRDCMVALAEVVWDVRPVDQQTVLFAIGRASVDKGPVWEALVKTAPPERLEGLSDQLESAYLRSLGLLPALRECAKRRGRDVDAWLVQIARRLVRDAGIERILRDALERADDSVARNESVTLAGTTLPDHSLVVDAIARMEQEVRKALVTGDVVAPGPVLVRAAVWPRLVADVHAVVSAATGQRDEALAARAELEDTIREQRQRLEERRAALHEARTEQTQLRSESTQRLAVSLFKTVAAALDDSFESQSLGSLQDQVLAAMARLRIRPMLTVGDVTAFDPDHHAWTGEGYPPREVVAITPGFVAELEGGEELVLAFARVVAPTEGQGRA